MSVESLPSLNLAHLIGVVRVELQNAEFHRRQQAALPLLQLKEFTLELNFVVNKSTTGSGGFELKVLSFGAEKTVEREQVQKITLKFALDDKALENGVPGSRFSEDSQPSQEAVDVEPLE